MNEKNITRVAQLLSFGVSLEEIHDLLIEDMVSEYDIFLTVKAAEIYNKNNEVER